MILLYAGAPRCAGSLEPCAAEQMLLCNMCSISCVQRTHLTMSWGFCCHRRVRRILGGGPARRGGASRAAGAVPRHQLRPQWHAATRLAGASGSALRCLAAERCLLLWWVATHVLPCVSCCTCREGHGNVLEGQLAEGESAVIWQAHALMPWAGGACSRRSTRARRSSRSSWGRPAAVALAAWAVTARSLCVSWSHPGQANVFHDCIAVQTAIEAPRNH